jgi:hypothetical protein
MYIQYNAGVPALYYLSLGTTNVSTTAYKILSFRNLSMGWDYGTGCPMAEPVIQNALKWSDFLEGRGFLYADAFPGSDGEIVLAAGLLDHYVEVIVESDAKTISVAYDFQRKQVCYQLHKSPEEAKEIILEIGGKIWNASTLSIQENITQLNASGLGPLLGITRGPYQSLDVNVSTTQAVQYANTYVNIFVASQESLVNHPFFGNLKQIAFLLEEA